MHRHKLAVCVAAAFLLLLVNTAYIWAFASATIFYMGNVLVHVVLGAAVTVGFLYLWMRDRAVARGMGAALGLLAVSAALGFFLTYAGALMPNKPFLWAHIFAGIAGLIALIPWAWRKAGNDGGDWLRFRRGFLVCLVLLVVLPGGAAGWRKLFPNPNDAIRNPLQVPASMEEEGGGPKSPFWPSSANTNVDGIIPADFFLDSQTCGECH